MKKLITLLSVSGLLLIGCSDIQEGFEDGMESATEDTEEVENETEDVEEVDEVTEEPKDAELPEELEDITVKDTRDDTTGNWRRVVTPKNVNMPENALAYNEEYMEENEVHHIISFATNTTTMINDLGGMLLVDITEYEEKEEHSADTIGNGMLLGSYNVYKDTGEIEEINWDE